MSTSEQTIADAKIALQQAVAKALSRKKQLNEFAVVNRDGKPYRLPATELPDNLINVKTMRKKSP